MPLAPVIIITIIIIKIIIIKIIIIKTHGRAAKKVARNTSVLFTRTKISPISTFSYLKNY